MNEHWLKVLQCRIALVSAEMGLLEATGWVRAEGGWKHPEWASCVISQELAVREASIRIRQPDATPG